MKTSELQQSVCNNEAVSKQLNQNINCNWRPNFQQEEDWKKQGVIVAFVAIKTKDECAALVKGIDSAMDVRFFGAVNFSRDIFDGFFEANLDNLNFSLYGTCNPVFFISPLNIEVSVSKPIFTDNMDIDIDYTGEQWLKNAPKWLAPDNDNDFNRSALLLNAYEESDNYVFFFSHNIKNLVEFDVMSNIAGEGVFCKGVVFNVADLVGFKDNKTDDLFK